MIRFRPQVMPEQLKELDQITLRKRPVRKSDIFEGESTYAILPHLEAPNATSPLTKFTNPVEVIEGFFSSCSQTANAA
jgi:hypothetical protein